MWVVIWTFLGATLFACGITSAHAFDRLANDSAHSVRGSLASKRKAVRGLFHGGGLVWQRLVQGGAGLSALLLEVDDQPTRLGPKKGRSTTMNAWMTKRASDMLRSQTDPCSSPRRCA